MHTFAQKPKATQQATSARSTISGQGHFGQSPEARSILHLQRTIGNQAVQQMLQTDAQKLQRACPCGGGCPKCQTEQPGREHESFQTKRVQASDTGQIAAPPIVHEVLRSPGQPLDPATRAFMEPRFGHDFSRVQVHFGGAAAQSARDVHAQAYTVGRDIVFGESRFAPGTHEGRRLLAHELAHTVQQQDVRYAGGALAVGAVGDAHEQQAEASSERALRGETASIQRTSDPPPVTAETDFTAVAVRLDAIIRTGPMPSGTRVIGAAIVDIPGYTGPREIRAISSMATDELGQGAEVQHAGTPQNRTLSATRGIYGSGPRREFPFSHINDAEMKIFEQIQANLPAGARGTVHFSTMRFRIVNGQQVLEPIPACSGCTRATFEMASNRNVQFISHAATHPTTSLGLSSPPPTTGGTVREPPAAGSAGRIEPPLTTPPGRASPAAKTERATTAEVGAPLEPVVEATPGYRPERGAGFGGAFQILQAMQFSNLQRVEVDKFLKRYAELQPKIDAWLEKGYSVELILIVEKPDRPDVLCAARAFCDQSQFIYYHDFYINYVESVKPVIRPYTPPSPYPTIGLPGGRDAQIPYTHQGGSARAVDEDKIKFITPRHPDHHCEYRKETLYPREDLFPVSPVVPRRQPAQPEKPKPRLDPVARQAAAAAPARVYVESENIVQYRTASAVIKALGGNPLFGEIKEDMGGGVGRTRTIVSYRSELDEAKAEALAAIVRANGVPTARAELSGSGNDDPGVLTIWFGRDVEK